MVPWRELGRAPIPGSRAGETLVLAQRGDEYAIRLRGAELMNSRQHASEEALARLGCAHLAKTPRAHVLVGGLGMGFTLRAALDALRPDARVTVVELVPEILAWNRDILGDLARRPLDDPRVEVKLADYTRLVNGTRVPTWNAILLDIDNGPDAFTTGSNAAAYGMRALQHIRHVVVPGGTFCVWSVEKDARFSDRLKGTGFDFERHFVPSRPNSKIDHVIWVARNPANPPRR